MKTLNEYKSKEHNTDSNLFPIARTAGILYLIIIICGLFSELFVRSVIIAPDNVITTAENIISNIILFRVGFISDLIMVLSDIGVALLFYMLFKTISKGLSLLAAFFRLVQAAILGMNLLNYFMPLILLNRPDYFNSFTGGQLNSLVMFFLNAHGYGYLLSGFFFGVSCLFLGYLIFKSEYFPRWLGIFVILAGFSYLIDSTINFTAPQFVFLSEYLVMTVAVVSELSLCLFLLIKGAGKQFLSKSCC